MTQVLAIYDNEGTIINPHWSGYPVPKEPVGVPFMWIDVPEDKTLSGIDISLTPHQPIFEDIPPSEIDQLKQTVADLTEIVLTGGM